MPTTSPITTLGGDRTTAELIALAVREMTAVPCAEQRAFSAASLELAAGALLYVGDGGSSVPVDPDADRVAGELQALARELIALAQTQRAPLEEPAVVGAMRVQRRLQAAAVEEAFAEAAESLAAAVGTLVALAHPATVELAGALALTASDLGATGRTERPPALMAA